MPYCVIGAIALGVHGFVRATGDVDLLTTDERVLSEAFWPSPPSQVLRGEWNEALAGTVRWMHGLPHDLIVARGYAATHALATARPEQAVQGAPVATPLALVLLKLEAGSALDQLDIVELVAVRRTLDGAPWVAEVPAHVPRLSRDAQETWSRVEALLRNQRAG